MEKIIVQNHKALPTSLCTVLLPFPRISASSVWMTRSSDTETTDSSMESTQNLLFPVCTEPLEHSTPSITGCTEPCTTGVNLYCGISERKESSSGNNEPCAGRSTNCNAKTSPWRINCSTLQTWTSEQTGSVGLVGLWGGKKKNPSKSIVCVTQ